LALYVGTREGSSAVSSVPGRALSGFDPGASDAGGRVRAARGLRVGDWRAQQVRRPASRQPRCARAVAAVARISERATKVRRLWHLTNCAWPDFVIMTCYNSRRTSGMKLTSAIAIALAMGGAPLFAQPIRGGGFEVSALSARPGMVSGGDVLIRIVPPRSGVNNIIVTVNGRTANAEAKRTTDGTALLVRLKD